MWIEDVNLNDPWKAVELPFRWIVNNKKASTKEILAEWIAIRHNHMGIKVNKDFFKKYAVLYVPKNLL